MRVRREASFGMNLLRNGPTAVLMYHSIATRRRDPFQLAVSPEHFAAQIERLREVADVVPFSDVLRSAPGEIRAFHNACAHRGRQLTSGCGRVQRLHCPFHGWQFDLDGRPVHVVDLEDHRREVVGHHVEVGAPVEAA